MRIFKPNSTWVAAIKERLGISKAPQSNDELAYATGLSVRRVQEITRHLVLTNEIQQQRVRENGRTVPRFSLVRNPMQKTLAAAA